MEKIGKTWGKKGKMGKHGKKMGKKWEPGKIESAETPGSPTLTPTVAMPTKSGSFFSPDRTTPTHWKLLGIFDPAGGVRFVENRPKSDFLQDSLRPLTYPILGICCWWWGWLWWWGSSRALEGSSGSLLRVSRFGDGSSLHQKSVSGSKIDFRAANRFLGRK